MSVKRLCLSVGTATAVLTGGCCTMFSSKSNNVPINISPPDATIIVIDMRQGLIVQRIKGSGVALLRGMTAKSTGIGDINIPAQYQIYAFGKDYFPATKIITAEYNSWMWGNLLFLGAGGVGGLLAMSIDKWHGVAYIVPDTALQLNLRPVTEDDDELKNPRTKEFYEKTKDLSPEDFDKAMMQRLEERLNKARLRQSQAK